MLLVYISVEKLISIKFTRKRHFLRSHNTQLVYFISVTAFSCLFYLPVAFFYDIATYTVSFDNNSTNSTKNTTVTMCSFVDLSSQTIVSIMDLVNRVLVPFFLMTTFTILLLQTIFKSRNRSLANYKTRQNKLFKRDIKFAISSIILNVIYLIFHLPLSIYVFFPDYFSDLYYMFDIYLLYACYSINFYLIFVSNSLFRREFLAMFKKWFKALVSMQDVVRQEWV